jgi:hypothetical protein
MELVESIFTHLFAAALGAAIVWYRDRPAKRQLQLMMEAIDTGKEEGKDWRFVRDQDGTPIGFRLTLGASASSDNPRAL